MRTNLRLVAGGLLLAAAAACTVQETPAPPLQGPSTFALDLGLQAVPDSLLQDGASQAVILIEARGPDGRAVRGQPLSAAISVDGSLLDFGTLSAKTIVTGEDGRARLTYTAPPRPLQPVDQGTVVTILVTPIGGDFRGAQARQVDIRLVPPGVILPPNGAPVPAFAINPASPVPVFTTITLDAAGTTDEGVPCGGRCTYAWTFGDGGTATGQVVTHQYRTAGAFSITLTVTDDRGTAAALTQPVTVTQSSAPIAAFSFSPTSPAVSQDIFFTAEASRPATGRRIVTYVWNFGSGAGASGITTSKRYDVAGTYNVTLTVTDDANQQGTSTQAVVVGGQGSGPTAVLTASPQNPTTATVVFFDGSASRGPSPIVEYRFTWGDNTADTVGTSPQASHQFTSPGVYVVRLTVRDSAGRTATTTVNLTVT